MIYPSPLDPRPMTRAQRTLGLTLLGLSIVIYIVGRVLLRSSDFEYWHLSLFLVSLAVSLPALQRRALTGQKETIDHVLQSRRSQGFRARDRRNR